MSKLGFIADVHIKVGQKSVPEAWAVNRFHKLFEEIAKYNSKVDKWIIGGDVFDKVPNMQEVELFYDFITVFTKPTFIIPGNHESLKKNTTFLTYFKKSVKRINPLVQIIDDFYTDDEGIDYIPYNKLKEYHPSDIDFHGNILITHVRGEIPPHVKPEVPLDLFDRWKLVLAGDLHSYSNSQRNILYPGSPITTSFHRDLVDTGMLIVDTDMLSHIWVSFDVPQLIRKTVKAGEPTPTTDYHHTVYEVEGTLADLANLETSAVVDKKLVKRTTETALILDPKMSMRDEAKEYMLYILNLGEDTTERILKVFDDEKSSIVFN